MYRSSKSSGYVAITTVEKTYGVVCEEYNVPARKHTQFWKYVTDLDKDGLIATVEHNTNSGPGRSQTHITLLDIPAKVLAKKIETILEDML